MMESTKKLLGSLRIATISIVLILLFGYGAASGQPYPRFEIAAGAVYHTAHSPWSWVWITSVDSVPSIVWDRIIDLGLTMPQFKVYHVNDRFPRDLLDSARSRGLHVSLIDVLLTQACSWERRYYQVEEPVHFDNAHGVGEPALQDGFSELGLRYDLLAGRVEQGTAANGIVFRENVHPAGSTVRGFHRYHELVVNQRYYLTMRCGIAAGTMNCPPDSDTAVVRLRFRYGESEPVGEIPGSAFYLDGRPREAFEYSPRLHSAPMTIVLRADTIDRTTFPIEVRYFTEVEELVSWGKGHWRIEDDVPDLGNRYHAKDSTQVSTDYDLELEYLGRGDIFIDAVCFSSSQAYGLFVGDSDALPNFRDGGLRTQMVHHLEQLGVTGDTAEPLRAIELLEISDGYGTSTTMNLIAALIDSMAGGPGRIQAYTFRHPYGVSQDEFAHQNGRLVSAYYQYPIWSSLPGPEDPAYLDGLFGNPQGSLWYASWRFQEHAVAQKKYHAPHPFPFQPAIANNDFSFRDGWRWPVPEAYKIEELREPTAAELRVQVNLALCYGAKRVLYYQYGSMMPAIGSDSLAPDGRPINRGVNGFVNCDMTLRRRSYWGEDKWDSTRTFNHGFLKIIGSSLAQLRWENGMAYDMPYFRQQEQWIARVESRRQGISTDPQEATFVEIGRFADPAEDGSRDPRTCFLLVLNKRTDTRGQRHIRVMLSPDSLRAEKWLVTDLLTDSTWMVTTLELGKTGIDAFYPSGGARLFRLRAVKDSITEGVPSALTLQTYPNPFAQTTLIRFTQPAEMSARLSICNMLGQEVAVLHEGEAELAQTIAWTPVNISRGLYICRLQCGSSVITRLLLYAP